MARRVRACVVPRAVFDLGRGWVAGASEAPEIYGNLYLWRTGRFEPAGIFRSEPRHSLGVSAFRVIWRGLPAHQAQRERASQGKIARQGWPGAQQLTRC